MESNSTSSPQSSEGPWSSHDDASGTLTATESSRRTTHSRNRGGLWYGLGVAWTHFRPFLPFFLVSCLVVVLVYLLHAIIYSGPFTDPLFFHKFDQRWPKPSLDQPRDPGKGPLEWWEGSENTTH